jgi:hypothetical protein
MAKDRERFEISQSFAVIREFTLLKWSDKWSNALATFMGSALSSSLAMTVRDNRYLHQAG